tara:strand:+ start:481 stop:1590 length:1110 start_codon:yes stop_codon:yes gene_type:complete
MRKKILIGIPPKNHIDLAMDEVDGLENLGYSCETITYTRNNQNLSVFNKLMGVLANAFDLVKHLNRFQPDILYLNSRFEPVGSTRDFITLLAIKFFVKRRPKIAIKSHGSNFDIFIKKSFFYKKMVLPFLIEQVDLWWFLSQDEKRTIALHHAKMGSKIFVTPNIINPRRSVSSPLFLEKYGIPKDKFTFLFVGRMVKEKGVFSIIKSIPLFEQRDECIFIFVGNGDDFEKIKLISKELNLDKYVCFLGFIPEEECDHFYANTDALVFPSHDEGFAMALFKSLACGMPILTTQIRAAKDYLKEPNNCLWVDGHSEQSVATALNRLYEDTELRKRMSENNVLLGRNFLKEKVTQQMQRDFLTVTEANKKF